MESRIERDVEDSFIDAHMRIHFAKHGTCRKTRIDDFILDKGHLIGRRRQITVNLLLQDLFDLFAIHRDFGQVSFCDKFHNFSHCRFLRIFYRVV